MADAPKYVNLVMVRHTGNEFIIDLLNMYPDLDPKDPNKTTVPMVAEKVEKVVMTPQHAKSLAAVLANNIEKYENTFGTIEAVSVKVPPNISLN